MSGEDYCCSHTEILNLLGSGSFSRVHKGVFFGRVVAVKITGQGYNNAIEEAEMLKRLDHPNILELVGIVPPELHLEDCYCNDNDTFNTWIITEYMAKGNLLDFIRGHPGGIPSHLMIGMARQIADGMDYLHRIGGIVHRDLAAKNILVNDHFTVKIADFGIAYDMSTGFANVQGIKWPVGWMAPEILPIRGKNRRFSSKADVWSFGVVLFEIWSRGAQPFGALSYSQVMLQVNKGDNVLNHINLKAKRWVLQLISQCFEYNAVQRPTFFEILDTIDGNM